jgi:hypothetical protein
MLVQDVHSTNYSCAGERSQIACERQIPEPRDPFWIGQL